MGKIGKDEKDGGVGKRRRTEGFTEGCYVLWLDPASLSSDDFYDDGDDDGDDDDNDDVEGEGEVLAQVGEQEVAAPLARPSNRLCQLKFTCQDLYKGLKVSSFGFGENVISVCDMDPHDPEEDLDGFGMKNGNKEIDEDLSSTCIGGIIRVMGNSTDLMLRSEKGNNSCLISWEGLRNPGLYPEIGIKKLVGNHKWENVSPEWIHNKLNNNGLECLRPQLRIQISDWLMIRRKNECQIRIRFTEDLPYEYVKGITLVPPPRKIVAPNLPPIHPVDIPPAPLAIIAPPLRPLQIAAIIPAPIVAFIPPVEIAAPLQLKFICISCLDKPATMMFHILPRLFY
jgi:hypothetical protein